MTQQLVVTNYDTSGTDLYVSPIPAVSFTAASVGTSSAFRGNVATDGNGNWVATGTIGTQSTDDAVTWANTLHGVDNLLLLSVSWVGERSVFLGFGSAGIYTGWFTSPDGVTWTPRTTVGFTGGVFGFVQWRGLTVGLQQNGSPLTPADSEFVRYTVDPTVAGVWFGPTTIAVRWDVGTGLTTVGDGTVMPMVIAANDLIVLGFSVTPDTLKWTTDPTSASVWSDATFTGSGQIWCAVWNGTQWVGGGQTATGGVFNWATSADGKAWTHHGDTGGFGGWCLVDGFFDGVNCWFSAVLTNGGSGTTGAVFQYDGVTWTKWVMPALTLGGFGIAGWPDFPLALPEAHIELNGTPAAAFIPVDTGHLQLNADDIVMSDSGHANLHADDAVALYPVSGEGHMQLHADNLIVLGSGVMVLHADDAEAPDVPSGNFNPNTPCTLGNEWFPRTKGAGVLASDLNTVGMWLHANTFDTIDQLWPFIANVAGNACIAVEVYDVTNGNPPIDDLSDFTFVPSSDLYVAPPPWTPGAYGSFNAWNPSLGATGPFYQALDSTTLTPYTWAISGQPVANDEFVFNFYGLGFDVAVRFDSVFGTQTGRWVTRIKSRALCAQYLALGATGAFQIQPYLWINGTKYSGPKQSVDVSQGNVEVIAEWCCNPQTGLPWTPADVDAFDTGFIGGNEYGMGWVCQPTGSANNLATILQAELIVESAPSDPRLVIGTRCVNFKGGWQRFLLYDPSDSNTLSDFTMTSGRDYLFVFRRGSGTGTVSLAYLDDPTTFLPGPPNWTTHIVELDPATRRPVQIGSALTPAYAIALHEDAGPVSLDSQPYMTLSPLDGVDRFPLLNEYFTNSPINSTYSMQEYFVPPGTDEYGWVWILVAQVASVTNGDLTVTIRDAATDTSQGVVTIVSADLVTPRHQWQKIGVRMDPAPVLASLTEYYFDITSDASPDQGWLVQVLEEGTEPPPQGGPTGTYAATWGGGLENTWVGSPLTEYQTKTACITVSTIPDSPTGFDAINLGEVCCIDAMVLVWDEYTDVSCGGWLAYEVQRRNANASVLVNEAAADWFRIVYIDTDPAVVSFTDYEAPNNTEVEYRLRVWRADGAPSDWTDTITGTTGQTCCGLTFTSNVSPDLTVFYPDVNTGPVVRQMNFPSNTQTFQPFDQNGSVVYRELPNRFVSFDAKLKIRDGETPCGPGCNNPADLIGEAVFDPIRAICRAGLPYVCVKNESGDVWFAYVNAKSGDWQQAGGREIDGQWALYTFDVSVLELTNTPAFPDVGLGGS